MSESTQATTNTRRLIERAKGGDEAALSQLLETHADRLLASVRADLGDRLRQRLESQDVMQEVYLDALRSLDKFVDQGPDSFFAWLRRIAANRLCDVDRRAFRTIKRGPEVRSADLGRRDRSVAQLFDALAVSGTSPSGAADQVNNERILKTALDQLSEDQRAVIEYRYLEQLNVAETAAKMDRSERAIRSLCARALIRLRELLSHAI